MPLYIEYDKTDGKVKRLLTADSLPKSVAYLAYQEIPNGLELDMSLNFKELLDKIKNYKQEQEEQKNDNQEPEVEVIEV